MKLYDKCPVCQKKKRALSELSLEQGEYLCACNSIWYYDAIKHRSTNPVEDGHFVKEDFNIVMTIAGNTGIKKNSQRIVPIGKNTHTILPSHVFAFWASIALKQIHAWMEDNMWEPMRNRVNIKALYYRDTRRDADLSNLHEGIQDLLTLTGFWKDDQQVESHDGSRKLYDPFNPRIELTITPFKEETKFDEIQDRWKQHKKLHKKNIKFQDRIRPEEPEMSESGSLDVEFADMEDIGLIEI